MEIKGLTFRYPSESFLFEDFSFTSEASLVILRGASGCGKTTLLNILFGNQIGDVSYSSIDIPPMPYLILQDDSLCPWLTGVQNIIKFLHVDLNEYESSPLYQRTKSFIGQRACNMSFGQRRLVELFRAILFKPKLLLWDEPLNYLDNKSREIVVEELRNYILESGCHVVLTDHFKQHFGDISHEVYLFPDVKPINKLLREE